MKKIWWWVSGALALVTLLACGPTGGGSTTPAAPAPPRPDTITFWVYAYSADKQEYMQNVGLTLNTLDANLQPVTITNHKTGQVTAGTQSNDSTHTPTYWQANLDDPAIATVELSISAIMPKGAYLVCEVHNGPAGTPPMPHQLATLMHTDTSEISTPSGVMSVATVLMSSTYPF